MVWLPMWQETIAHLHEDRAGDCTYIEKMYKRLVVGDGKIGVSANHLRSCLQQLEELGLVVRKSEGHKKPYSLTELGERAAIYVRRLKLILRELEATGNGKDV